MNLPMNSIGAEAAFFTPDPEPTYEEANEWHRIADDLQDAYDLADKLNTVLNRLEADCPDIETGLEDITASLLHEMSERHVPVPKLGSES